MNPYTLIYIFKLNLELVITDNIISYENAGIVLKNYYEDTLIKKDSVVLDAEVGFYLTQVALEVVSNDGFVADYNLYEISGTLDIDDIILSQTSSENAQAQAYKNLANNDYSSIEDSVAKEAIHDLIYAIKARI